MSDTTAAAVEAIPKATRRRGQLPDTEAALATLALSVARHWQTAELPELLWLTKTDLLTQAGAYAQHHAGADAAGDERTPQASRLQALDRQFDASLKHVKAYLKEAYDKEMARGYFPAFGITTRKYTLPRSRVERVKALEKLLNAVAAHGFGPRKYGTAYWEPRLTEYTALVQASIAAAGERSRKVGTKVSSERQLRLALRALVHHIKANYPTTYKAQLRAFGFLKEVY